MSPSPGLKLGLSPLISEFIHTDIIKKLSEMDSGHQKILKNPTDMHTDLHAYIHIYIYTHMESF